MKNVINAKYVKVLNELEENVKSAMELTTDPELFVLLSEVLTAISKVSNTKEAQNLVLSLRNSSKWAR